MANQSGMRVAMLVSGGGTTAGAIYTACTSGRLLGVEPACLIASAPEVGAIARLKGMGFPEQAIHVISPKSFATSSAFGKALLAELKDHGVDFVGQYGWLAKTPANVIEAFRGMMVNQHPGPLDPPRPGFGGVGMYGRRVHSARLLFVRRTEREFWSEATAQRVAENFDEGAVLKTKRVPIMPEDDVASLQARMLPLEHEVHIETLGDFASGDVKEYLRQEPLVREGEREILEACKKIARATYPEG